MSAAPPQDRAVRGPRRAGLRIARVGGVDIRLDFSWLLIFGLVLWSLSAGYFPARLPELDRARSWTAGLVASLLFFASLLVHELAHCAMAIRAGVKIREITLFLFGGATEMTSDPRSPGDEFRIAVAGPLASFALAGVFFALLALGGAALPRLARVVVEYLASINFALGVFNLMPGFPLDGGRLLLAAIWWRTGSRPHATQLASNVGQAFALGLMILGALQLATGALLGGAWVLFIGMFLRSLAVSSSEHMALRGVLEQSTSGVAATPVSKVMEPLGGPMQVQVAAETPLADALEKMLRERRDRLIVVRGNAPVGLLTRGSVRRFLAGERSGDGADPARPPER